MSGEKLLTSMAQAEKKLEDYKIFYHDQIDKMIEARKEWVKAETKFKLTKAITIDNLKKECVSITLIRDLIFKDDILNATYEDLLLKEIEVKAAEAWMEYYKNAGWNEKQLLKINTGDL